MALLAHALPAPLEAGWLPAAVGNADDGLHDRLLAFAGRAET
jgi:hypothetical protein